jgi:outer membrane lipoprotein carrier protein
LKSIFTKINLLQIITCSCVLFSVTIAMGSDITKDDILSAMENRYAGQSFEAKFTQVSKLAALDITEIANGIAWFSHPGKMRWEYMEPEQHEIITNGKTLWIFRPDENQVMLGDASRFFSAGAGGAFLSDISLIRQNYDITVKEVTKDFATIVLVAKKITPEISSIEITISQKTAEIEKVITYNAYNDTTIFDFFDIQFKKIDPGVFEFEMLEGLNVIEMD